MLEAVLRCYNPVSSPSRLPPFLAMAPSYGGALAAVRSLGALGIPVTVAGSDVLEAARWSRYATRWVKCPVFGKLDLLVEWLVAFGQRQPGHVIYPSDDETAWAIATHAAELRKHFRLFEPPATAVEQLLDKKALYQLCSAIDVETAPTWFPENSDQIRQLADVLPYPVLIKPRSQVLLASRTKGRVVGDRAQLVAQQETFLMERRFLPDAELNGGLLLPMLQRYFLEAPNGVYTLSGFVEGERYMARAALKVLQRPRRAGIGVCFEEVPLEQKPLEAVIRICRAIGYRGVFEVEFIRDGDRRLLIDFNPRFYGQMAFDIARGMPLALLAWQAACGDRAALEEELAAAVGRVSQGKAYCDRFYFRFLLLLQRLTGSLSSDEYAGWLRWYAAHREELVDGFMQRGDLKPGLVHAASALGSALLHPRSFLREYVLQG
jgi:D-aspartate ligase